MERFKHFLIRLTAVLLLLCLAAGCAAEGYPLKRGDKGKQVREIQQMLITLGFLNGRADGKLGRNTEEAFSEFLFAFGTAEEKEPGETPQTFSVSEEDAAQLRYYCGLLTGDTVLSYTEEEQAEHASCYPGEEHSEFCWRHQQNASLAALASEAGNPPVRVACTLLRCAAGRWLKLIPELYDEWGKTDPATAKQQKKLWQSALKKQQGIWKKAAKKVKKNSEKEMELLLEEVLWLEDTCVNLCFDLHGAEPQGG